MVHNLTARCMKCREQKEIKDLEVKTTKNNRKAAVGICPTCGTKLFRFLPKDFTIKHLPENEPDVKTKVKVEIPTSPVSPVSGSSPSDSDTSSSQDLENRTPENTEKEMEDFDEVME